MARLASEAQMAFYPTSTESLEKIFKTVKPQKDLHIIDPCCGKGDAIKKITSMLNATSYGVELDEERAKEANLKLKHTLNADAIWGVSKSYNFASLLFLNPPYGVDSNGARLEEKFVRNWSNTIIKNGYLLLVINSSSATSEMAKAIQLANLKPIISLVDKDNEEYKKFGQYFLLFQKGSFLTRSPLDEIITFISGKKAEDIDSVDFSDLELPKGNSPKTFKELKYPIWKYNQLLKKVKG